MAENMHIAIAGCNGRMGRALIEAVLEAKGCTLSGGSVRAGSAYIGKDIGMLAGLVDPLGVAITDDVFMLLEGADAVIDFTTADYTLEVAQAAAEKNVAHIVGTTGLSDTQQATLDSCAAEIPVIQAANMSLGANLLAGLVEQTAARLGEEFDIEISEMHHHHKQDVPSGTALMLGTAAASGRKVVLADVRCTHGDSARKPGDIGFSVMRGGDVVGEHSVLFAGVGERLELTHKATDRSIFARGAVRAALLGKRQSTGNIFHARCAWTIGDEKCNRLNFLLLKTAKTFFHHSLCACTRMYVYAARAERNAFSCMGNENF